MSVPTIDITTLADRVAAGTVGIHARGRRGTGVVLPDDQLLTTAHNVRGDHVEVLLDSGVRLPARVLGVAEDLDLAVLAVADSLSPLVPESLDPSCTGALPSELPSIFFSPEVAPPRSAAGAGSSRRRRSPHCTARRRTR